MCSLFLFPCLRFKKVIKRGKPSLAFIIFFNI